MTGDRVRLGVPRGNRGSVEYAIVQWVDVDRVALVGDLGNGSEIPTNRGGELTVCQLSTGRCRVAPATSGPVRTWTAVCSWQVVAAAV